MPQAGTNSRSLEVVLERTELIRSDMAEVKEAIKCIEGTLSSFQREYEREHMRLATSVEVAHRRLDDIQAKVVAQDTRIEELVKAVQPLIFSNRILTTLASALMVALIGLTISIATGQIALAVSP